MSKSLPARPSLDQLKNQAKDLLKSQRLGDNSAHQRFHEHHPRSSPGKSIRFTLADAQLVIAREYAFTSWAKLKQHVQSVVQPSPFEALALAVKSNNTSAARDLLAAQPELKPRLDEPAPDLPFGATLLLAAVHHRNKER